MRGQKLTISIWDLVTLLNKHIEIFEYATALLELQTITQKIVEQDKLPTQEEMETFRALLSAIDFIRAAATDFIEDIKTKHVTSQHIEVINDNTITN